MLSLIKRLSPKKQKNTSNGISAFPPLLTIRSGASSNTATDLDESFYGVLLGATSQLDTELNQFEKKALQQVNSLLQNTKKASDLLPRLPTVLPQVIKASRNQNASAGEIAELIEKDQILVAEVMRLVNSPLYKTRQEITHLKQATVMLGQEGLKQLITSAMIRPLFNASSGHFVKLSYKLLWEHSEKTAISARQLCQADEALNFNAFLGGILSNMGFIAGFNNLDSIFDGTQSPNSKLFNQKFTQLCRAITASIARSWRLPDEVCQSFQELAFPENNNQPSPLSTILYTADHIAKAQILADRINLDLSDTSILLNGKPCVDCLQGLNAINVT